MREFLEVLWECKWLILIACGLIGLLTALMVWADTEKLPESGVIIRKAHHGAWTQFVSTGKATVPIHHPESWHLIVDSDGTEYAVRVKKSRWESAIIGDQWVKQPVIMESEE